MKGVFLSIIILINVSVFAQPANDDCSSPIDISDEQWHAGDNTGATFSCTDHRSGHCGAPSGCNSGYENTNTTDMCCGISGIEGSVWFSFSISDYDTVYIDFRRIECNPYELCIPLFGCETTALQGYVLRRIAACPNPCTDTTMSCFNASDTNAINGQMEFIARASQIYYIEIDTKKNSLDDCTPTADPCVSSPTCHSTCSFEIRIRRKNPVLAIEKFELIKSAGGINIDWVSDDDFEYYKIKRERIDKPGRSIIVCNDSSNDNQKSCFDIDIKENGNYLYTLQTSEYGVNYKTKAVKSITYDLANIFELDFYPNPTNGIINIHAINMENEILPYSIYSIHGKLLSSSTLTTSSSSIIDISSLEKGVYLIETMYLSNKIVRKIIIE